MTTDASDALITNILEIGQPMPLMPYHDLFTL